MPTGPLSVVIQHLPADAGPDGGGMTSELLARFLSNRDDNTVAALVRWGSSPAAPTVKATGGARPGNSACPKEAWRAGWQGFHHDRHGSEWWSQTPVSGTGSGRQGRNPAGASPAVSVA
jgi:hypothetical protein